MRISILTSCTSKKAVTCPKPITAEDFNQGISHVRRREKALDEYRLPAGKMYVGQQHRHLMQGVQAVRRRHPDIKIEVAIISAGYGFVSEDELIAPYERAFNGRSKADIRDLADRLDIPKDTRCFLARRADLILVLLGSKYLQAIAPDETLAFGGPTLLFCGREAAQSLPDKAGVKKVVIIRDTAKRFSEGLVWLKGYLARRLLQRIAEQPSIADEVVHPEVDVLDMLDTRSAQVDLEL